MINIDTVSWRNFLGYGDYTTTIDFKNYRGVCMIEGEHEENSERDEGDEKYNNSGKTGIVEAMVWGLFGGLTRKQNQGDKVINWHTGKNCIVTINTTDGYQISRMRKYKATGHKDLTEVIVLKDGEDITKSTNVPAQNFINKTFDLNYDTFIRSRVFGQFNTGFMELSDTQMRRVLEWLMNIHHLGPRAKAAKAKVDGCIKKIDRLNDQIDRIDNEIDSLESEITELVNSSDSFQEEIQEEVNELKQKLVSEKETVEQEIKLLHQEISIKRKERSAYAVIDIDKLTKDWDSYNTQLSQIDKFTDLVKAHQDKIDDLESKLEDLIDEEKHAEIIDNFENAQQELSNKQELLTKLIKASERAKVKIEDEQEFLSHEHGSICKECRQETSKKYIKAKSIEVKKNIEELSLKYSKIKKQIDKLKKQIDRLTLETSSQPMSMAGVQQHNKKVKEINREIKQNQNELEKAKNELTALEKPQKPELSVQEAESNNKYFSTISEAIADRQEQAKKLTEAFKVTAKNISADIKKTRNKNNPYQQLIADRNKKLRNTEEEKANKDKEVSKLRVLKAHLDYIRESYGNKRKIKAFWLSELIPEFNKYLDYYQNFFEVSNKVKFDELLSPKMDKWGFHTSSGGECKRIDLSIMFALNDLHVSNFGPQSNFMVLDEVDGRLDPFTMNKLVSLLNDDLINRNDGLTNIFIISHRKEMKDRFPSKIRVKYKQEKSYIING